MKSHHSPASTRPAVLTIAVIIACLAAPAAACLWDSDTLGIEARGMPGIAEIITGRFERNPPLYYEMRLARVTQNMTTLQQFDDAGVACDRLGRGDEAIEWMTRKKVLLDKADANDPRTRDHLYRYYANLGTFHAHRWLRSGRNRDNMDDMKTGRELIAKAIEINPDAHFGREKYQLMAMEWIIDAPKAEHFFPSFTAKMEGTARYDIGGADAVEGLVGLIALGDAWQSIDVFHALGMALQKRGNGHLAMLAALRIRELVAAGRTSIHPDAPTGDDLAARATALIGRGVYDSQKATLQTYFTEARAAADKWHDDRGAFMLARLKAGHHPDTDARFWDGYTETPPPHVPGSGLIASLWDRATGSLIGILISLGVVYVLAKITWDVVRRRRRRGGPLQEPALR